MPLTRSQLLMGNTAQGRVLTGQVQGVRQGAGTLIAPDGTISVDASTLTGLVRLNNVSAFNNYVWPASVGPIGTFLSFGANNTLVWAQPDTTPAFTAKGQLLVGLGPNQDFILDSGTNGQILMAQSSAPCGLLWTSDFPSQIVAGNGIAVNPPAGTGNVTISVTPATTTEIGGVIPDGTIVTVSPTGVIAVSEATTSTLGIVQPDGTTIDINGSGVISAALATATDPGIVEPDSVTISVNPSGVISANKATTSSLGVVQPDGTTIAISPAGVISAVGSGSGTVTQINTGTGLTGGPINTTGTISLLPATSAVIGGVVPDNTTTSVAAGGVISAVLATNTTPGIVEPDNVTLSVNGSGILSGNPATLSTLGVVKPDGVTINITPQGLISANVASASELGVVQPDGTTITVNSNGVISAVGGGGGPFLPLAGGTMQTGSGAQGVITLVNGSQSSPSINFAGNANSGFFYAPGPMAVGITINDWARMSWDSNGQTVAGDLTQAPSSSPFSAPMQLVSSGGNNNPNAGGATGSSYLVVRSSDNPNVNPGGLVVRKGRGSNPWSPNPLQTEDWISQYFSYGWCGSPNGDWSDDPNNLAQVSITFAIGDQFIDSTQIIFSTQLSSNTTGGDPALTEWVRIGPAGQLGPVTDNTIDLGSASNRWAELYVVNSPFVGLDTSEMASTTPLSSNEGLSLVTQLNPVKYILNTEKNDKQGTNVNPIPGFVTHYGLTGQDLANAASSLGLESDLSLFKQDPDTGLYSVAMERMVPVLVQALQELNTAFNNYVATHP